MNPLIQRQQEHNAQSRGGWECFAEHRRRVMQLLLPAAPLEGARLCVLGAGNCNDLDLAGLAQAFAEVHLVDLDAAALAAGVAQQQPAAAERISLHGGCDLSGILDRLSAHQNQPADAAGIQSMIDAALAAPAPLAGQFETAASVCLLSQLIHSVVLALGAEHPRFVELMAAVRLRHLRLLTEMLAPGGRAVLVTDLVSSDTCPELATIDERNLPALTRQLVESRNFFHGTNPAVMAQIPRADPQLRQRPESLQITNPWRWNLGPRVYAVYALQWQRE